ncbi:MAG: ATP-binding protein, partial [Gammaproteobacteria bacterium]|nr:ATP-binding protein [Gammaproteobacteria bacterium]
AERAPGGMGIFLMKQMMDEVVFQPLEGGGNELRLVKHLYEP